MDWELEVGLVFRGLGVQVSCCSQVRGQGLGVELFEVCLFGQGLAIRVGSQGLGLIHGESWLCWSGAGG